MKALSFSQVKQLPIRTKGHGIQRARRELALFEAREFDIGARWILDPFFDQVFQVVLVDISVVVGRCDIATIGRAALPAVVVFGVQGHLDLAVWAAATAGPCTDCLGDTQSVIVRSVAVAEVWVVFVSGIFTEWSLSSVPLFVIAGLVTTTIPAFNEQ